MNHRESLIPSDAKLVINHVSRQRPYFNPDPNNPAEDYVCIFTIENSARNVGFMYVQHFPVNVAEKDDGEKEIWLFENMASASFIKSHPLK